MAANQSGACPGVARYLLGMGPLPPPRSQDIALAQIQGALDGGAFEQPWNMYPPLQAPLHLPPAHPVHTQVPVPSVEQHGRHQQPHASSGGQHKPF